MFTQKETSTIYQKKIFYYQIEITSDVTSIIFIYRAFLTYDVFCEENLDYLRNKGDFYSFYAI
jgi:hypothetical protein